MEWFNLFGLSLLEWILNEWKCCNSLVEKREILWTGFWHSLTDECVTVAECVCVCVCACGFFLFSLFIKSMHIQFKWLKTSRKCTIGAIIFFLHLIYKIIIPVYPNICVKWLFYTFQWRDNEVEIEKKEGTPFKCNVIVALNIAVVWCSKKSTHSQTHNESKSEGVPCHCRIPSAP